jgi:cysteine desulfurase / selenocysteine lyase
MRDPARLYFDNAATSFPKPEAVYQAMDNYARQIGGSAGRSAHDAAIGGSRLLFRLRGALAELCGGADDRVAFTKNATEALNLALFSLVPQGGVCVHGPLEHNAVMRPLQHLARTRDVRLIEAPGDAQGRIRVEALASIFDETPVDVLVTQHASNVNGVAQDLDALGRVARRHGAAFVVDAAQSAGCLPLAQETMGIDALAVTGHKGLLGPTGIGALLLSEKVAEHIESLLHGGTGSDSESETMPAFLPDRLEGGTLNTFGAAGLLAGVEYLLERGVEVIAAHEAELRTRLIAGLSAIDGVRVLGDASGPATAVVSFTCGLSPSDLAYLLAQRYGIAVRAGLHCAPRAHAMLGTLPEGAVRLAPGPLTPVTACDEVVAAVADLVTTLT